MNLLHPPGIHHCSLSVFARILGTIRLVATDCDGVLTDGGLFYSEVAGEIKKFNVLDGMGFALLHNIGIKTAIITAKSNILVKRRADDLGIHFLVMNQKDKLKALSDLCVQEDIPVAHAAFIGDDVYDIPAIQACGLGCAPASAHQDVLRAALYITAAGGGNGCFREIADLICSVRSTSTTAAM